ncbi:MAG: glycine/D-amino acid oxidase-like deaminating enzyme, partial [Gammaproteobacteria bacterium]
MHYPFTTDDFKAESYWWDETPRPQINSSELPAKTDVLIIGSGYTGLHCAIQTASAGRDTLVIDAEAAGWGCSSRNGGQISGEIKPGFEQLCKKYGSKQAFALVKEARNALDWLTGFIDSEAIDCDLKACGRFQAAHNPRQFDKIRQWVDHQPKGLEQPLQLIEKAQQADEIDSDYYHGGVVIERHCSLSPAKYHAGLLALAQAKGAKIESNCAAIHIERNSDGFKVTTSRGSIQTRELVVATSGYTPTATPWQRRRIVPIGSYMLATEAMNIERADKLMPQSRVF